MAEKPVIFHIPKWYPNRYDPLLGIFVKRHVLSTLRTTVPVVLYAMASRDNRHWYEWESGMEDGILTYRVYYRKSFTGISALDKLIKLLFYFVLLMSMYRDAKRKTGKPSVVQAHILLRTAAAARWIKCLDRVPYVLLEHSSQFIRDEVRAFNVLTLPLARYLVRKAAAVITVSECLARGMKERYGLLHPQYKVIYNCVDTAVFFEKETLPSRAVKELLYVAEFDNTSKNITGLLQAIRQLSERRDDFRLTLVGYGKDENFLKEQARALRLLDKRVFFAGRKTAQEVSEHLRQADLLLMFSNFETLSCIITESLCCGTPVGSTAVGGIVEIVSDRNGFLVPKADEEAMARNLEKFLDGQLSWEKHEIALHARDLFSNEAVGLQLTGVYQTVRTC